MARTLDRSRKFALVYGEDVRRFYQDRIYFDAAGNEVPAEPGSEGPGAQPDAAPPAGAGLPAGQTAKEVTNDYRGKLKAMTHAKVKQVFLKAGGDPTLTTGAGSQARMSEWLLTQKQAQDAATGGS